MPDTWTEKDERQYDHVRESNLDRGMGEDRAEEIAGRTVNKHRREVGRTPQKTTQGTGNPNKTLEDRTRDELRNMAKEMNIAGRGSMKKDQLVDAIRKHQQ